MVQLLESIVSFFVMVKDFIVNLVTGIFSVIQLIPQGLAFITGTVAYLPSVLTYFAAAGIAICIVFFIIDR